MNLQRSATAACFAWVFLALAFPLAAQEAVAEVQEAPDPIAALVPADAVAIARIGPISQVEAKAKQLVSAFEKDLADFIDVGMLIDGFGLPIELDRTKPAAIALRLNPAGEAPLVTFILPVTDASATVELFAEMGFPSPPVAMGSFVAFSPDGEYEPGRGQCRLLARLAASDASLAVDLGKLVEAYREFVDFPLEQAEEGAAMGLAMGGMDEVLGEFVESAFSGTKAFIAAVDTFDLRLDTDGNEATLRMGVDVKPGTQFSNMRWSEGARFDHLLPALPGGHPVSMMMSMDFQKFYRWYGDFIERVSSMDAGLTPSNLKDIKQIMDLSAKSMEGVGRNMALSFGLDKRGIGVAQVLDVKTDPMKLMGEWIDLYKLPVWEKELSMEIKLGELEKRGELQVLPLDIIAEWELLLQSDPDMAGVDPEMVSAIISKVFGSEDGSFSSALFSREKVLGYMLGAKPVVDAEVEAMVPWKTRNSHGAWALSKAGAESAFILSLDFRGVMQMIKEAASMAEMGELVPAVRAGGPAPVAVFAGARGTRITMGASTKVNDLAPVIRQLMRGSRR